MKNISEPLKSSRKGSCLFKLLKLAIITIIVLGVALYFTLGYIADYALKTVTSGTGIDAGVGSIGLDIGEQKVSVNRFYMTNPQGFPQDVKAIAFSEAVLDADVSPAALLSQKLITVDEVKIIGLKLAVQLKTVSGIDMFLSSPKSNLTAISDALNQKLGLQKNKAEAQTQQSADSSEAEPMRFIVRKIIFKDGDIVGGLNSSSVKIPLPSFTIENLGVEEGGLSASELITRVIAILAKQATYDVAKALIKEGANVTEAAATDAGNATVKAVDAATKSVGDALKKLF